MLLKPLPKILVVDDEPQARTFLRRALEPLVAAVGEAENASQALEAIESRDYDIVLCDLAMPGGSGLQLLAMANQSHWDLSFILMSGRAEVQQVAAAVRLQAADFLLKPFSLAELTEVVGRCYLRLLANRRARAYHRSLEAGIQRRTRDLESALRSVESNYATTLEALVAALDAREHETFRHSFRVRAYTIHLARLVGYPPALMTQLQHAALLHDIGKLAVSDAILLKTDKLTAGEWISMRQHPVVGEQILNRIAFLRPAAKIVRHHHERFDGAGYPDGQAGDQIPLGARLFAFADTLDAMTSDRPYRSAVAFEAAAREVEFYSGAQFDPRLAEVFLRVPLETWKELRVAVDGSDFQRNEPTRQEIKQLQFQR